MSRRRTIPKTFNISIGSAVSRTLASKYEAIARVEPFLPHILVGAKISADTNKNFTFDSRRNVANASTIELFMSHRLLNRV